MSTFTYSESWADVVLNQKFWALGTDLVSLKKQAVNDDSVLSPSNPLSHMSLGRQVILPVRMCSGKIYLREGVVIEETNLVV